MTLPFRLERLIVFLKREFKLRISYRMTAVLSVFSALGGLFSYGLLGNTAVVSTTTQAYGISLASFLVSGVAFSPIITNGLGMFYQHASPGQIEEVMVTPTDFREFILMSSIFNIILSVAGAFLLFFLSVLLFGLTFSYNVPILLIMVLLGVASSIGLGFFGLGFQLVYKQTYVLSWLLYSLTGIVGNMVVPVQILPAPLRLASYLTPQYYFFTGIRVALGAGSDLLTPILITFTIYTIVILVVGLAALNRGLHFARRAGTQRWI